MHRTVDRRALAARMLLIAGSILLGLYAIPTLYGAGMARLAEARFRSRGGSQRLWDSARIRSYEHALRLPSTTPEAILRVPRVGIEAPLFEGTSALTLNRGVGHVAGTALPGAPGNLAVAGHRDGFFRPLKDVVPGDIIEIERDRGTGQRGRQVDRYRIRRTAVVFPDDASVLRNTTAATLTLITCFPFYYVGSAPQRFIVTAELIPATPST